MFTGCSARPRISPDGRLVAYRREDSIWVRDQSEDGEPRRILDLDGAKSGTPPVWSPDGSQLVASLARRDEGRDIWLHKTLRVNVDGSGKTELNLPPEDGVQDWSPDGRWLLTASSRNAKSGWQLYVMRPDGTEQRQITEGGNPFYTRFSPDGRSVLYTDGITEERRGIWVVDLESMNRRRVLASGTDKVSACWSPDGKRIAVLRFEESAAKGKPGNGRLLVIDLDGVLRSEFPISDVFKVDMPDWR